MNFLAFKACSLFILLIVFEFVICTFANSSSKTTSQPPTTKKYVPPPFTGLNVLGHNSFELVNPYRPNSVLKFSLTGVNVTSVKHSKASFNWALSLLNFEETIRIYRYDGYKRNTTDYNFHWEMNVENLDDLPDLVEVCFHYGHNNASWYSTYEQKKQSWPMDTGYKTGGPGGSPQPFQTGDPTHSDFGSLIEYLFLTSDGFAVMLSDREPLRLRRDPNNGDPLLCASIDKKFRFTFKFNVLATANIKSTYANITSGHTYIKLKSAKSIPDERIFKEPIWSTRVALKKNVSQTEVLAFANQIKQHSFPASQVEIDDCQWETHYGDLTFDSTRFPDPKKMVDTIHALGYRVSLWIHPFVSTDSVIFKQDNSTSRYLAKDKLGRILKVKWWNSAGKEVPDLAIVDFSDDKAVDWFVKRLEKLKNKTGIDTFKLDGGERQWYGNNVHFSEAESRRHPDLIAQAYATDVASKLGKAVEVKVGYKSQDANLWVRMPEKTSTWDAQNGLQSLIPTALTFSLAGYPFILPDIAGGGNGNGNVSEELFIRWLQVSTFLPAMQLSVTPWSLGNGNSSALKLAKKFIDLHVAHAATMLAQAKKMVSSEGKEPLLIRPMWWATPNEPVSWKIADQFMVGENLLVAPVVVEGQKERSVLFPPGTWIDETGKSFKGPGSFKVQAPLEVLPHFKRSVK